MYSGIWYKLYGLEDGVDDGKFVVYGAGFSGLDGEVNSGVYMSVCMETIEFSEFVGYTYDVMFMKYPLRLYSAGMFHVYEGF